MRTLLSETKRMLELNELLNEKAPKRVGDYGSIRRPYTLKGGHDSISNRENTSKSTKKMNVDQSYKNLITKAHIKNDRMNRGSESKPHYYDHDGNIITHRPKSSFKKSGVGK